jgi:hypothetical protein
MQQTQSLPLAESEARALRFSGAWALPAISLTVLLALIALQNVLIGAYFPHLARVTTDFSPAYLRREIRFLASASPQTIFLGDSVLWGYRLPADEAMVSLLADHGCACRNLAFKKGSPPNYYALLRLLQAGGVRPKAVVLEINQKVLNKLDTAYNTLHPAVAALALPLLTSEDRALLAPSVPEKKGIGPWLDHAASSASALYAMRSDIRETLYGDTDAEPAKLLTPDAFEATYDLSPLDARNVGVHFLERSIDLLREAGVPVVAFMTPTNHALLHDYIDGPMYRANGLYLQHLLQRHGARVLDLDAAFRTDEFLDEVHLTVEGQRRLAAMLGSALR